MSNALVTLPASKTWRSLKHVRTSHPPKTYTLLPTNVQVCALNGMLSCPWVGALYQYIPLAGAGATEGALLGSGSGGSRLGGCRGLFFALAAYAANDTLEDSFRSRDARLFCDLDVFTGVVVGAGGFLRVYEGAVATEDALSERATMEFNAVVDIDRVFCPGIDPDGLANEDSRDPGDPGVVAGLGTSSPPLCLFLTERLAYFSGEAVAERAGGTVCGLEDDCLSDVEFADVLLAEPPLSAQLCKSRGAGTICVLEPRLFE